MLTFKSPVPVRIKEEKYPILKPALDRMGIRNSVFWATAVTDDGRVVPDPNCLDTTRDPANGAPIAGKHCQFEAEVLDLIRQHNIRIPA